MSKRIYKVTNIVNGVVSLVEASSQGQAIGIVSNSLFKTEVAGTGELARMLEGGARVLRTEEKKSDNTATLGQPPAANAPAGLLGGSSVNINSATKANPLANISNAGVSPAVAQPAELAAVTPATEGKPAWLPPAAVSA